MQWMMMLLHKSLTGGGLRTTQHGPMLSELMRYIKSKETRSYQQGKCNITI